jgi:hypothetical protein
VVATAPAAALPLPADVVVDPSELLATWKESPSDKLTLVPSPERAVGVSEAATVSTVSSTLAESPVDPMSAAAASGAA